MSMKYYSKRHVRRLVLKAKTSQNINLSNILKEAVNNYTIRNQEDIGCLTINSDPIAENKIESSENFISVSNSQEIKNNGHFDEQFLNSDADFNKKTFVEKLIKWAIDSHIPHIHLDALLTILREENLNVPKCSKTLLQTPRICNIKKVYPGNYCHLGMEKGITHILNKHSIRIDNKKVLYVNINIDGLPCSDNSCFWPILAYICLRPVISNETFIVGVYHGPEKPKSSLEYLDDFVTEMKVLSSEGFVYDKTIVKVEVNKFICDAPAKAFMLNVKGHNSSVGCNKCTVEGTYINRCMTFQETNSCLRSNESFRNRHDEEYHKGKSALEDLQIDMVKQISLDYMHLVLLGVAKRLFQFMIKGKQGLRLVNERLEIMSKKFVSLQGLIPNNFARKSRDLTKVDHWKATEIRQVLLYTGPYILEGLLSADQYTHFLNLHSGIRILSMRNLCQLEKYNEFANVLLRQFVEDYGTYYGNEHITYNVHNLIHLSEEVKRNGPLDDFSSFPFENYMLHIKNSIQSSNRQLQQLVKRIIEQRKNTLKNDTDTRPKCTILKERVESLPEFDFFYRKLHLSVLTIDTKHPDCYYILTNDDIVSIKYICSKSKNRKEVFVVCDKYTTLSSYYEQPIDSRILGFFVVKRTSTITVILADNIKYKCIRLPLENEKFLMITIP